MVTTELYTLASGTATDAYDMADKADVFLVNALGWSRQYTIASGVSNRDRVYTNSGGEPGNLYNTIYYRLEAVSGTIYNHLYTYYASDGGSESGHITGYEKTANLATAEGVVDYRMIGNKNLLWLLTTSSSSEWEHVNSTSVGYCDSYYLASDDLYPACLVGHSDVSYDFTEDRVLMYDYSGTGKYYHAENYGSLVQFGSPQSRDGNIFGMPIALMGDSPGSKELRGELRGVKQAYGSGLDTGDTISIVSGSVSGTLYVSKYSVYKTFLFGPYEEL